jgi:hypothetical protein
LHSLRSFLVVHVKREAISAVHVLANTTMFFVRKNTPHHHTRLATMIWASSALLCCQSIPHPTTTPRIVSHTCRHMDTAEPRMTTSSAFHSSHRAPVEFMAQATANPLDASVLFIYFCAFAVFILWFWFLSPSSFEV